MRRVTIAVLLIGILTISTFPRAAVAQSAPWIDSSKATQYATDLIGNYTNLVNQKLRYYANFSVYEPFLTLYAATG
ncbi:MAG: hypothetical protein OK454_07545, partial [Thaumarchaeota archaeon]|nr:hypothetical protein [Nitrososphaerota archaeon]